MTTPGDPNEPRPGQDQRRDQQDTPEPEWWNEGALPDDDHPPHGGDDRPAETSQPPGGGTSPERPSHPDLPAAPEVPGPIGGVGSSAAGGEDAGGGVPPARGEEPGEEPRAPKSPQERPTGGDAEETQVFPIPGGRPAYPGWGETSQEEEPPARPQPSRYEQPDGRPHFAPPGGGSRWEGGQAGTPPPGAGAAGTPPPSGGQGADQPHPAEQQEQRDQAYREGHQYEEGRGRQPGEGEEPGGVCLPGEGDRPGGICIPGEEQQVQSHQPGHGEQPGQEQQPGQGRQAGRYPPGQGQPYQGGEDETIPGTMPSSPYGGPPGYPPPPPPGAPYGPGGGQYGYGPYQPPKPGSGLATASLVLGVASPFLVFVCFTGLITAILSIIFGWVAIAKGAGRGRAIAGIVISVLSLILFAIVAIWFWNVVQECAHLPSPAADRCFESKFPWMTGAE